MCQRCTLPKTFYKRELPAAQVDFSSEEGRRLLRASLDAGTAEAFFRLIANFHTQAEPSWCGLGTLVTVLNALEIDPHRTWKGPWRWFREELLDCCTSIEKATAHGLVLEELATIARCNGAHVDAVFAEVSSEATFRAALERTVRSRDEALVLSYSRAVLGQTGMGHYSPVAAWDAESDRALVLDVARFKYPPHWVKVEALWRSMLPIDEASGRSRGWMVLRADGEEPTTAEVERVCCRLSELGVTVPGRSC